LCAIAGILNVLKALYFYGWMPQTPRPEIGRIYPADGGHNIWVYVTKSELEWQNFVRYDLMTAEGGCVVLLGIVMLVREQPPIRKIQNFWS
jgi:drug/metabolite transporter superfamily protein YnfA